ncbi:MAG: sigma-70 family RNA polymerase sigma factor [Ardenticatenales bacterium]
MSTCPVTDGTTAVLPLDAEPIGGDELALVAALRRGDEDSFSQLVTQLHPSMVRLAQLFVRDRATAEEVVQEAWVGVLQGLDRFEGRSALRTWIFRIVANKARTRGRREARTVPFSAFTPEDTDDDTAAVDADRFWGTGGASPGHWQAPPEPWVDAEGRVLASETGDVIAAAIADLPERQRLVITMRDVEGWDAEEVCNTLDITATNQRVLLHRARTAVRHALEAYLSAA